MTQLNAPVIRRAGGSVDVYTGLLFVAIVILAVGIGLMALKNIEHSKLEGREGGLLKLVETR